MSFELRVEFSGLCLFAIDKKAKAVGVLMPDFGFKDGQSMQRPGESKPREAHRAYMRMDAASLGLATIGGEGKDGAPYQVVRLLHGKKIGLHTGLAGLPKDKPVVPSLDGVDKKTAVTLDPQWFSPSPNGLLGRVVLRGGEFDQQRSGVQWTFPNTLKKLFKNETESYQNIVTWRATVAGAGVAISLASFDGSNAESFVLRPVLQPDGRMAVVIRFGNLCRLNPLAWSGFEIDTVKEDHDFRWFFDVVSTPAGWAQELQNANDTELPCPQVAATTLEGSRNCSGTRFSVNGVVTD